MHLGIFGIFLCGYEVVSSPDPVAVSGIKVTGIESFII